MKQTRWGALKGPLCELYMQFERQLRVWDAGLLAELGMTFNAVHWIVYKTDEKYYSGIAMHRI